MTFERPSIVSYGKMQEQTYGGLWGALIELGFGWYNR